jgi:DNA ligase (NAD+)
VVIGRIEKYVKSLDIQGVGSNVVESIVRDMGVTDASDLYVLNTQINDLSNLKLTGGTTLGLKRAQKILDEIDKKRELTLSDFLGSLGIFGLGKRRVTIIQNAVPGKLDTLNDWFTDTLVTNATEAGVPNIAQRIHDELVEQETTIRNYIKNGVVIKAPLPKYQARQGAHVICITGQLSKPKAFFADLIHQRGDVYADSFSKSVTHLVAADINSGSGKLKKAEKAGVKVISEPDLLTLLRSST